MDNFNPVEALEEAGISDYHVDYNGQVVRLHPEDIVKMASSVKANKILPIRTSVEVKALPSSFYYHGWVFMREVS